ncbi:hypothetical protein WJX81_006371 [Elliptochloris bilobata]|uniref:Uncharacterized protein n=1 Tax=Elliptochloris bilobata TaxID=381761 RepID=A0AAW1SJF5_9CHLO
MGCFSRSGSSSPDFSPTKHQPAPSIATARGGLKYPSLSCLGSSARQCCPSCVMACTCTLAGVRRYCAPPTH